MNDSIRLAAAPLERVAMLIAPDLKAHVLSQLLAEPRFRTRILGLAAERLGRVSDAGHKAGQVLAMTSEDLQALAWRAGAVWHGRAVARIIDGESRRRLADHMGLDTLRLALEGLAVVPVEERVDLSVAAIIDAMPAMGAACLAAWSVVQPLSVARRLDLIRPNAAPTAAHLAWGPPLIEWVIDRT